MPISTLFVHSLADAWKVLLLFLIPIGGGIPAGVLAARSYGIGWPVMSILYFISDVILACLFEPLLKLFIVVARRVSFLARFGESFKKTLQKTAAHYGTQTGPLALVMISFGADPMTGRAAAVAAGHGFVTGWLIAITGDMIYFVVIMASTLWLNDYLGDGTWTMLIILVFMMGLPVLIRRIRKGRQTQP